jgi:hypothetical protein
MADEDAGAPVRGRRRGANWRQVGHGLHVPADADLVTELAAWQLVLPSHGSFTHLTGAALRGWWLPEVPTGLPVFAALRPDDPRPLRAGMRSLRTTGTSGHEVVDGLRVASAVEIVLACARDLRLLDLVVVIDAALHAGDLDLDELERSARARRRGAPAVRAALPWTDSRSESAWETALRVIHRACGVDVEPQHEVLNELGAVVARGDLWLVGTQTFHEYDGSDHLSRPRQVQDLRRLRRLDDQAWARRGYTAADLVSRSIGILRDADRTIGRPHRPERIKAWYALLRESCFTPAGRRLLSARLGIERAA